MWLTPVGPRAAPSHTDEELMLRSAAGDRAAFDDLVTRHRERVTALARRYVRAQDDADDVAQEAFVRLYRSRQRYRPDAKFSTFLYRIVVNLCIELSRKQKRRPSVDAEEADPSGPRSGEPERVVLQRDLVGRVKNALQRLPDKQRTAVVLCRYEGRSYREIAEVLGCTEKAVEAMLYRARLTLSAELDEG